MTETRFAVRVPHTLRAWYARLDFPNGKTELVPIVSSNSEKVPCTLDTTLTLEDIEKWELQDCECIKVETLEREEENEVKLAPECEETVKKRAAEETEQMEEAIEKLKKAGVAECGTGKIDINEYDHPKRYTSEDGKDLIDHMEEGLIPEEQVRGFLRGNALKCLVRYKDKNGTDDLIKANEYIRRLIAFENEGNNR